MGWNPDPTEINGSSAIDHSRTRFSPTIPELTVHDFSFWEPGGKLSRTKYILSLPPSKSCNCQLSQPTIHLLLLLPCIFHQGWEQIVVEMYGKYTQHYYSFFHILQTVTLEGKLAWNVVSDWPLFLRTLCSHMFYRTVLKTKDDKGLHFLG